MDEKYKSRVKVITANTYRINDPDDPSFPWMIELVCRPPSFMSMAFVGIVGPTEIITVIAKDQEALEAAMAESDLRGHPRTMRFRVSGPEGVTESVGDWSLDPPRRGMGKDV
jgi:hypothetical protein